MNKIYFAGSIRGGRDDVALYVGIVDHLKKYGKVLTEHVADPTLLVSGEDGITDPHIHDRDMQWLSDSNVVVAEVTKASLGVGYEIGRMVERNLWIPQKKAILCLYRPSVDKKLSAMINGSSGVKNAEYTTLDEAVSVIDGFFAALK